MATITQQQVQRMVESSPGVNPEDIIKRLLQRGYKVDGLPIDPTEQTIRRLTTGLAVSPDTEQEQQVSVDRKEKADELSRNILTSIKDRGLQLVEGVKRSFTRPEISQGAISGPVSGLFQDILGEGILAAIPDDVKESLGQKFQEIASTPQGKKIFDTLSAGKVTVDEIVNVLESVDSEMVDEVRDLANTALAGADIQGVSAFGKVGLRGTLRSVAREGIEAGARGTDNVIEGTARAVRTGAEGTAIGRDTITEGAGDIARMDVGRAGAARAIASGVKETAIASKELLKQTPGRITKNVASRRESREAVEKLPEIARAAVKDGVEISDANLLLTMSREELDIAGNMLEQAKKFEVNRGVEQDPAEIIGSEMRSVLERAENLRQQRGKALGEAVAGLPSEELPVLQNALRKMRQEFGFEDLRVNNKGKLDFSDTVLASASSANVRKQIQTWYDDLRERSGKQLQNLREEIFDQLGGKKTGGVELRKSEQKLGQAIRDGIADTLEDVSDEYRRLNKEYAEIINPIQELRTLYRQNPNVTDDVLDAKGALLARRLTSRASSGVDVRRILGQLQAQIGAAGMGTLVDITKLQEFWNGLQRYYDVTKGTTFAGQTEIGIRNATGGKLGVLLEAIKLVTRDTSLTPEVTQKAFEELVKSLR